MHFCQRDSSELIPTRKKSTSRLSNQFLNDEEEFPNRSAAAIDVGVTVAASSQPSHTITCSMFPWDDRGDGHPSDTTLLNTLAPVLVPHGLLTHGTTKLPLPATKRTKN
ncbi:hypothetical protein PoB_002390100 [Plakobranchus ocellatus]|uniref:Uncharacterized protein n=1 Tax=Plakobranchus ocellatus TaxID=259542 RepID=A0AAV3ZN89_9GAST|nr:hypothetical protein PoB_002390100 [Plakobranchus ocellatus]